MRVLLVGDDLSALDEISDLLRGAGCAVSRATNARQALQLVDSIGFRLVITEARLPEMDGLQLCQTIRSRHATGYAYTIVLGDQHGSEGAVAALSAGADDYIRKPFDPEELLLRVGVAGRIASLGARDVAIFALAKLADSRDPDTGQHLERMRNYCWLLARWLRTQYTEITDDFIDTLYQTSALHDIGKVGIPDSILLKRGPLTEAEFEVMKTHTTIGAQTLSAAIHQSPDISYFTMARDIALTHHENFDGSGYPQGLRGCEIPLCGRIVAMADTYDALASRRPYREQFDHALSRAMILEESDRFDPRILMAFLDLEREFDAIRGAFSDGDLLAEENLPEPDEAECLAT